VPGVRSWAKAAIQNQAAMPVRKFPKPDIAMKHVWAGQSSRAVRDLMIWGKFRTAAELAMEDRVELSCQLSKRISAETPNAKFRRARDSEERSRVLSMDVTKLKSDWNPFQPRSVDIYSNLAPSYHSTTLGSRVHTTAARILSLTFERSPDASDSESSMHERRRPTVREQRRTPDHLHQVREPTPVYHA